VIRKTFGFAAASLLFSLFGPGLPATAAEPEAVVVRNRLYADEHRLEVGLFDEIALSGSLTSVNIPELRVAYHFSEVWALDLFLGYAFGGVNGLFCAVQNITATNGCGDPSKLSASSRFRGARIHNTLATGYSDLPDLWTPNGFNAQVAARWEPIYGKLSLLTEVPVHFKWFVGLGGGVAHFSRTSLNYCNKYDDAANAGSGDCTQINNNYDTLKQDKYNWIANVGTGFRFIFAGSASLDVGIRDYIWADSYRTQILGSQFTPSSQPSPYPSPTLTPGTLSGKENTGITNSVFVDLGLTWTF
jgi:outer membrane beta-barrel protein